jgi:UDPglucose 6-dehydrogenase
MGRKVIRAMGAVVTGKTVGVLGLTFKPNTDDMRDAPSIPLIQALQDAGISVRAYDPEGMERAASLLSDVAFMSDPYAVADGADALVIVTEWDEFRALDLERVASLLASPILVDLRNIYPEHEVVRAGLSCTGIGRRTARYEPTIVRMRHAGRL